MRRSWRLLSAGTACVCCAVYDPSLMGVERSAEAPVAGKSGTGSQGAAGAGAGNDQEPGDSGAHGDGGEAGGGGAVADEPAAGAAGEIVAGGGTSSHGGTSGGGASVPGGSGGMTAPAAPVIELIDDFETPDVVGIYQNGRKPLWYLMTDGTVGTQQPDPLEMTPLTAGQEPVAGSGAALWVACSGFSGWGSGVGVDLLNAAGKQAADLSAYAGLSFWAKIPGSYRLIRANVPDVGTDPSGAICSGEECNDHFGVSLTLSAEWKRYEISFSDLQQVGWGLPRERITLSAVYSIHFQIAAGHDVELWIDDLALVVR